MRKPIIVGNWKMNQTNKETQNFIDLFSKEQKNIDIDFAIAAPFTSLATLSNSKIPSAAQNFHQESKGAYTGEISLKFLEELNIKYAIIGHSERRQYFAETNQTVNSKLKVCLKTSIIPIVAFGETEQQYDDGKTIEVITKQLKEGLEGISSDALKTIVLAYEPIWAIGTGKRATSQQAQNVAKEIRQIIKSISDEQTAQEIRIQYGGSVKPDTIKELMSMEDIDGALVGGAALDPKSFLQLITFNK